MYLTTSDKAEELARLQDRVEALVQEAKSSDGFERSIAFRDAAVAQAKASELRAELDEPEQRAFWLESAEVWDQSARDWELISRWGKS